MINFWSVLAEILLFDMSQTQRLYLYAWQCTTINSCFATKQNQALGFWNSGAVLQFVCCHCVNGWRCENMTIFMSVCTLMNDYQFLYDYLVYDPHERRNQSPHQTCNNQSQDKVQEMKQTTQTTPQCGDAVVIESYLCRNRFMRRNHSPRVAILGCLGCVGKRRAGQ